VERLTQDLPSGWDALGAGEKAVRLHRARNAWNGTAQGTALSWTDLDERQQRFAAVMLPMVQDEATLDPVADTRTERPCPECGGEILVVGRRRRIGIFNRRSGGPVIASWFCQTCNAGLRSEAGWWRDHRTPRDGKRRIKSVRGWEEWREYAARDGFRAHRVESEIAALLSNERTQQTEED